VLDEEITWFTAVWERKTCIQARNWRNSSNLGGFSCKNVRIFIVSPSRRLPAESVCRPRNGWITRRWSFGPLLPRFLRGERRREINKEYCCLYAWLILCHVAVWNIYTIRKHCIPIPSLFVPPPTVTTWKRVINAIYIYNTIIYKSKVSEQNVFHLV
jgi:hypothetical protein